ncbi:MAG: hypothetical protein V7776_06605 [Halopseudomonas aestusnigri]
MNRRSFFLAPFLLMNLTNIAQSAETKLSHDEIQSHLNGAVVVHRSGGKTAFRQSFSHDGTTTYKAEGRDTELGKWSIQGNQYCSKWGPFGWTCYDMTAEGNLITWIAKDGARFPGKMIKE